MYYCYVLMCADEKMYIGFSANVDQRVEYHNKGYSEATRPRKPVKLIFYEAFLNKSDALRREQYLKTNAGKRTLRLMLRERLKR
ncbi:MAG: GIY-YIG nuclease family protein [Parcubacteria group bacterium]|nr:GIY-YIG nuclease family protein [Parcubacteria group bacterium]